MATILIREINWNDQWLSISSGRLLATTYTLIQFPDPFYHPYNPVSYLFSTQTIYPHPGQSAIHPGPSH